MIMKLILWPASVQLEVVVYLKAVLAHRPRPIWDKLILYHFYVCINVRLFDSMSVVRTALYKSIKYLHHDLTINEDCSSTCRFHNCIIKRHQYMNNYSRYKNKICCRSAADRRTLKSRSDHMTRRFTQQNWFVELICKVHLTTQQQNGIIFFRSTRFGKFQTFQNCFVYLSCVVWSDHSYG